MPLANVRKPLVIFTDGSCEPNPDEPFGIAAGYGGVMFDPEDNSYAYFGGTIGPELVECFSHQGLKAQIVGQAELLPCLMARIVWADRMEGRAVIHYVDNEAARYALIKGTSPTMNSAFLTAAFWK